MFVGKNWWSYTTKIDLETNFIFEFCLSTGLLSLEIAIYPLRKVNMCSTSAVDVVVNKKESWLTEKAFKLFFTQPIY